MQVSDSITVNAPLAESWGFIWDIERLAACLPGCESIARAGDDSYKLRMVQRVGPFKVDMDVRMTVQEVEEGRRVVASGDGRDKMGNRLQIGRLAAEVAESPGGGTQLSYEVEFNLYGKLAALGNAAVKRKVEETRAALTDNIRQALS